MSSSSLTELADELAAVKDEIKFHFVDATSIEYCDVRSSPVLEMSLVTQRDEEGYTVWSLHFVESDKTFEYRERADNGSTEIL